MVILLTVLVCSLPCKQKLLPGLAPMVAAEHTCLTDNPVTRNNECNRVAPDSVSYRASCGGLPDFGRYIPVGKGIPEWNGEESLPLMCITDDSPPYM